VMENAATRRDEIGQGSTRRRPSSGIRRVEPTVGTFSNHGAWPTRCAQRKPSDPIST